MLLRTRATDSEVLAWCWARDMLVSTVSGCRIAGRATRAPWYVYQSSFGFWVSLPTGSGSAEGGSCSSECGGSVWSTRALGLGHSGMGQGGLIDSSDLLACPCAPWCLARLCRTRQRLAGELHCLDMEHAGRTGTACLRWGFQRGHRFYNIGIQSSHVRQRFQQGGSERNWSLQKLRTVRNARGSRDSGAQVSGCDQPK